MVLLISYDLNQGEPPMSYARIAEYIRQRSISSRKPLESQWLVETDESPRDWTESLRSSGLIDEDDHLFVLQVRQPYWGVLDPEIWRWMETRL